MVMGAVLGALLAGMAVLGLTLARNEDRLKNVERRLDELAQLSVARRSPGQAATFSPDAGASDLPTLRSSQTVPDAGIRRSRTTRERAGKEVEIVRQVVSLTDGEAAHLRGIIERAMTSSDQLRHGEHSTQELAVAKEAFRRSVEELLGEERARKLKSVPAGDVTPLFR